MGLFAREMVMQLPPPKKKPPSMCPGHMATRHTSAGTPERHTHPTICLLASPPSNSQNLPHGLQDRIRFGNAPPLIKSTSRDAAPCENVNTSKPVPS